MSRETTIFKIDKNILLKLVDVRSCFPISREKEFNFLIFSIKFNVL